MNIFKALDWISVAILVLWAVTAIFSIPNVNHAAMQSVGTCAVIYLFVRYL